MKSTPGDAAPTISVKSLAADTAPAPDHSFRRSEQLRKITAAIADAVEEADVHHAIVDQVAAALDASSAALFLCREDEIVELIRCTGYPESTISALKSLPLRMSPGIPAFDSILSGEPVWLESQKELIDRYPHLVAVVTPGRTYSVGCLPVTLQGKPRASLGFTFDDLPSLDADLRHFLVLVARYAGQALERLHLLERERTSHARAGLLYDLAASVNDADSVEAVFDAALDSVQKALGAERSSILVADSEGVLRFRAWRGLSDSYRRAVDGHSPWPRDVVSPEPLLIADAELEPSMADYRPVLCKEGINALCFIPLVANGRLIGKFMVYYDKPHTISRAELDMSKAIAHHVAAAIARFSAVDELKETVRFNEIFAGILGHDLRNPLSAIMAAAQLALTRAESDKLTVPLGRIISSGDRMSRMIDQLLDFTRVRVGRGIPLNHGVSDIGRVVRQAMEEIEGASPEWKLDLDLDGDMRGLWDSDRMSQVFSNLIGNAVRHGDAVGGCRISVDGTNRDTVTVRVHNMGVIPADIGERIFEPMVGRGDRGERSQGLGLGLYITKELVVAHSGAIAVSSSQEEGTMFTVTVPRNFVAEAGEAS